MSQLISQTQAAERFNLPRHVIPKLLAKVTPAYDNGTKTGRVVIYNLTDIEPILQAEVERRKAKEAPPPAIDINAMLDAPDSLKSQVKAVFGAVEIVRHRLEEVVRDSAEMSLDVAVTLQKVNDLTKAAEAQAKRNEVDDNFKRSAASAWFENTKKLDDLARQQDLLATTMAKHTGRLDRMQEDIGNLDANMHQRMDALFVEIQKLAKPTPLPVSGVAKLAEHPNITPYTGPTEITVPVTVTTEPAFVEPKPKTKPRRAVVLGLLPGQVQAVKKGVGDAWDLAFFGGSKSYTNEVNRAAENAEVILTLNSFGGKGPEALGKEHGKPVVRCAGTSGIVDALIERL